MNIEAFKHESDDARVPIVKDRDYRFTRKWFRNRNQTTWSTYLLPRFQGRAIRMIQIGVFEGMDLVWCFQNMLAEGSEVLAIDPWAETNKISQENMERARENAEHNLEPWRHMVNLVPKCSREALPELIKQSNADWDLIIIDGDHRADGVHSDAANGLELAKTGGWLVFDDVRNRISKKNHVQQGIDRWLEEAGDRVELAWRHKHCDCYEKIK